MGRGKSSDVRFQISPSWHHLVTEPESPQALLGGNGTNLPHAIDKTIQIICIAEKAWVDQRSTKRIPGINGH